VSIAAGTAAAYWDDAVLAAAVCAVDPAAIGGVALRARPGPVREAWLELLRDLLPPATPWYKIPAHVTVGRLLGGLDLAATLRAGEPVAESGLLAQCHGGIALLAMAERASQSTVAQLAAALDSGEAVLARDGIEGRAPAEFGLVALDEGADDDELLSPVLQDRLALLLDLEGLSIRALGAVDVAPADILAARTRLSAVTVAAEGQEALCATALALGVDSLRASLLATRVAVVCAALAGRRSVNQEDLQAASRLVLAPRATRIPPAEEAEPEPPAAEREPEPPAEAPADGAASQDPEPDSVAAAEDAPPEPSTENPGPSDRPLEDQVLEAARAAIPAKLLARLAAGMPRRSRGRSEGKSGEMQRSGNRGRPMGVVPGSPRSGARLSLVATLRAAAPWQGLRRAASNAEARESGRVFVERQDFRVTRFRHRSQSTTIFVVDASGSAALHRLAEAKGAVELLLADCYVRRDQVALIAFRGERADVLLPPTRSLVRAKRNLAALPGGGATPLTSAIDAAVAMADQIQRRGGTPSVVFLTDGRGNISRDGIRGREPAGSEALTAAAALRGSGVQGMVIDTSPRPHLMAEQLAAAAGALYLPLPHANAQRLRQAVSVLAE
jgi:magnesium chelatase subunit D